MFMTGRFVDISALLGSEFEAIQFLGVEEVEPFPHDDHEIIQFRVVTPWLQARASLVEGLPYSQRLHAVIHYQV